MITEDYVSFETARLLKEKGFNEKLLTFYLTDEDKKEGCFQIMAFTDDKIDNNHSDHCYLAPTLQMTMKWLREIYQIDIQVFRHIRGKRITFYARIEQNTHLEHQDKCNLYQSYEQACEAAIKYSLKNLI